MSLRLGQAARFNAQINIYERIPTRRPTRSSRCGTTKCRAQRVGLVVTMGETTDGITPHSVWRSHPTTTYLMFPAISCPHQFNGVVISNTFPSFQTVTIYENFISEPPTPIMETTKALLRAI